MMPLLFREFAYSINKRLGGLEILKLIFLPQVVLRDHFPTLEFGLQFCDLLRR
jgi:hypothetical protein